LDSRYQQKSVGGHHIPKYVCSARGFNITINTHIFFCLKKENMLHLIPYNGSR